MPIFEYTCSDCKTSFETLIRSRESLAEVRCPKCGGGSLTKNLSVFSPAVASSAPMPPRCETSGPCHTPNLPGCGGGMCGLN